MTETTQAPVVLPKMDPDVKARWLERLRSGDYTQTYYVLHRATPKVVHGQDPGGREQDVECPVGHCCLGVLLDIAKDDGLVTEEPTYFGFNGADSDEYEYDFDFNASDEGGLMYYKSTTVERDFGVEIHSVPWALHDWLGLETTNLEVVYEGQRRSLATLNDQYHLTFAQIADLIEDQL